MAKLYFRYGAMSASKSMNLLATAYSYELQNKKPFLITPLIDSRWGVGIVRSRVGLERKSDLILKSGDKIDRSLLANYDCILVDESQFLTEDIINQLREITIDLDIPCICYGLRTNYKSYLFEGSKRLMEVADLIEEIKTTCAYCNRRAIFNLKLKEGSDNEIELGAEELYKPVCAKCYKERTKDHGNYI